jgi:hypothetical protein
MDSTYRDPAASALAHNEARNAARREPAAVDEAITAAQNFHEAMSYLRDVHYSIGVLKDSEQPEDHAELLRLLRNGRIALSLVTDGFGHLSEAERLTRPDPNEG